MMARFYGFLPLILCGLPFDHVCSIAKMRFTVTRELMVTMRCHIAYPQIIVASKNAPMIVRGHQYSFIGVVRIRWDPVKDRDFKRSRMRGGRCRCGTNRSI